MLILLDNCDDFLQHSPEQFYREINNLHKELPKTKFIIILKEDTIKKYLDDRKLLCCKY